MPMQYRRLTAHLQTGSQEFNNRLSAYLTSNVAMRSGLEDAIQRSYVMSPGHLQQTQSAYTSPLMTLPMYHQQYMGPYINPTATLPPNSTGPMSVFHGRSASIANPTSTPSHSRSSPPQAQPLAAAQQPKSKSASPPSGTSKALRPMTEPLKMPSHQYPNADSPVPALVHTPGATPSSRTSSVSTLPQNQQFPLSTSLPVESQQLLAQSMDPNDPVYRSLMTHPQYFPSQQQQYYNTTSMSLSKQQNFHPNVNGMSATLAPSALDMNHNYNNKNQHHNSNNQNNHPASATATTRPPLNIQPSYNAQQGPFSAPPMQLNFDTSFPDLTATGYSGQGGSNQGSQQGTPTEAIDQETWDRFMNEGLYDGLPAQVEATAE